MSISPGERLGPYEILAPIGAGGMGEVYKVRDTRLGREVAIKIAAEQFSERFEREARAIAALNHPNICQLYDVGPNYLVMELVDGAAPKGPLPLADTLRIAGQIAEALEAAHEKGIVHRDLKPANIKIKADGTVKVLDFGLAQLGRDRETQSDPANSPTLTMPPTQSGTILGTAAYMSPEQARGKPVDKRSDIWSFGCVLYEMLIGKQAFRGETASDILVAVMAKEPDLEPLPPHLRPVIERCLRKDVRRRWQAMGDARIALEEAQREAQTTVQPRANRLPWAISGVAFMLLAVLAFVHFREKPPALEPVRFEIQPPPQNHFGIAFALSPDGRKLAFPAVASDGQTALWVRSIDSLEPKRLAGTEGAAYLPIWSPDSRFLAFSAGGKFQKIEAAGGPSQVICDTPQSVGGSWSPDGTILFSTGYGPILKVSAAGGVATPITAVDPEEAFHRFPFFLPDGRHFIYERRQGSNSAIYVGSVDSKPEQQRSHRLLNAVFAIYAPADTATRGYLLFAREHTLMAQAFDAGRLQLIGDPIPVADPVGSYFERSLFSVSVNGALAYESNSPAINRLTWFDRQGMVLNHATDMGFFGEVALSPDTSRLAVRRTDAQVNNDIWVIDLARGGDTRLTFDPAIEMNPIWSPDSRQVVFASNRNGVYNLYQKDSSGARAEEVLLKSNEHKFPQDWSRDGRSLMYSQLSAKTGYDLWSLPMTGDRRPVPFLQTQFNETEAKFSPDGRWVAYMSNASGREEIYVRPFPPSEDGGQWMISNGGGTEPRWRRDGKELFYLSGTKIMDVDISTNPAFRAGVPRVLFEARPTTQLSVFFSPHRWDVTPDGKRFLINSDANADNSEPINVVLNWPVALKK